MSEQSAVEQKYPSDHNLTEKEKDIEGEGLVDGFMDLFRDDSDMQRAVGAEFFRSRFPDHVRGASGVSKGLGIYSVYTKRGGYSVYIQRAQEGFKEELEIERTTSREPDYGNTPLGNRPWIEYKRFRSGDPSNKPDLRFTDNGSAVNAGREMLARAQKDFGKI